MAQATVQPKNISRIIRKEVINVMREVLSDPDAGLELNSHFIKRLKKSVKERKAAKTIALSRLFGQYNI